MIGVSQIAPSTGTRRVLATIALYDRRFGTEQIDPVLRLAIHAEISNFLTDRECDLFYVAAHNDDQATMKRISAPAIDHVVRLLHARGVVIGGSV
ncbi:MAG: hypothetical protein JWN14_800 [Chthonomonadales bacterium]|nr:hypothetical protein [Chthonomonadales bacterium]